MAISGGEHLGRKAFDLGQRVKAMLSPLEDVCRYREQRGEDMASFDVTPRDTRATPFKIAIAPGGVNIDTPSFSIRELPLDEAGVAEAFVAAFLAGRMRRVTRLSASGKALAAKTYVFDAAGLPLYKHRRRAGLLAGLSPTAGCRRERFAAYRSGSA
jgi:hypothetical protein